MEVTRDQLIRKIADESGYYIQDIKRVFRVLENVILECLGDVTDDEPVSVRVLTGLSLNNYVVPERDRRDPRTNEPIVVKPTVKLSARYSENMKEKIQEQYEKKKGG